MAITEAFRKATAGTSFEIDNLGFTSRITLPRENMVFFSVPYDTGWTATVNGEPVEIEKANIGFMAVKAPAGDCEIRFIYHTPGLKVGLLLTGLGILILAAYLVWWKRFAKPSPSSNFPESQA